MGIKVIPLSQLEAGPRGTLAELLDSGQPVVVELPDLRMVSIQSLEPSDDDPFVDELLTSNLAFRALIERSKASERLPFARTTDD
jgi:hypothetical protein